MAQISDIETRRLAEQERFDLARSPKDRNRRGQFATPPGLALEIARYARKKWRGHGGRVRFLDPAIGTGSFYSALRQVFSPDDVAGAVGIELDESLALVASRLWKPTGLKVVRADFTTTKPPRNGPKFDLVLTNPPYVRHHHLRRGDKERLQRAVASQLGINVSGLAGLYTYFLLLADAWLADGALSVWLVPSEFMDVNYGDAVKRYVTRNVTLLHIHRFCPSDVQFADALVSSAVVVFSKTPPARGHSALFSFGGGLSNPAAKERIPVEELATCRKWTRYPQTSATRHEFRYSRLPRFPREIVGIRTTRPVSELMARGTSLPATAREIGVLTLGNLFAIKRGLATGANDFFVLPRRKARDIGIPEHFLKPILPSPRHLQQSVIEAARDGYPRTENPLSLVDCDLPEGEVRACCPDLWRYLQVGIKREIPGAAFGRNQRRA